MKYEPIDFILSNDLIINAVKKEDWKTVINEQENAIEVRYEKLSEPIRYYSIQQSDRLVNLRGDEISFSNYSKYSFNIIDNLFNVTKGNLKTFFIEDPLDRKVDKFNSYFTDYGNKYMNLKKIKSIINHKNELIEGNPYRIYYPSSLILYKNDIPMTLNVDYFIEDEKRGIIRFAKTRGFNFYTTSIGANPIFTTVNSSTNHELNDNDMIYISSSSENPLLVGRTFRVSPIDNWRFTVYGANTTLLQTTFGEIEMYYQKSDNLTFKCNHYIPVRFDGQPSCVFDNGVINMQQINFRSVILT